MKRRDFTRSFGRSYDGPRLRNPFFAVPAMGKAAKYAILTSVAVTFLAIPAVFVYAPFMRYTDIRVDGLTTVSANDVVVAVHGITDKRTFFLIPGAHIFLARTGAIETTLNDSFHFAALALRREGRTLVVDVRERITEIAWTVAGATSFVDLTGVASANATPEALAMIAARRAHMTDIPAAPGVQPTMPIIDVRTGDVPVLGTVVVDTNHLAHILALDEGLRSRNMAPIAYTLDAADTPWLTVSVLGAPSLLVDITTMPDDALVMYDTFVRGRDGNVAILSYIDLRFGNHVYSKEK